ncbi:MAG: tRNA-queuosine alpha-mannosyltransferase domain-containing protein [Planctomycetota bacterium]|jgi:glycosyltransferase involved in cell wall biosynthesis
MKILALEPYYGGSHRAFIDGWINKSEHEWNLLTLPPYKWKWRMRHSAVTFTDQVAALAIQGRQWDVLFCTDMLNLAEFVGLVSESIRRLPRVVYFHENQLTYPVRFESERDYQFAVTNMTTALAADSVWFNSTFHMNSCLEALGKFLRKMPDYNSPEAVQRIRNKSHVYPPGIDFFDKRAPRKPGPLRILWAARAEHDKNPENFFDALKILKEKDCDFRLSVIGERFRDEPGVFEWAGKFFAEYIDRWGYQKTRAQYTQALTETDVIVSTAHHEFFGISVIEAVAAGAYPLVPNRLAYPEVLGLGKTDGVDQFFYDGTVKALADKLLILARDAKDNNIWNGDNRAIKLIQRFEWNNLVPVLDKALTSF